MSLMDQIAAAKARAVAREEQERQAREDEERRRVEGQCAELERVLAVLFGADVLERLSAQLEARQVYRNGRSLDLWSAAVFEVEGATLAISEAYAGELWVVSWDGKRFDAAQIVGKPELIARSSPEERWDTLLLAIGATLERADENPDGW